MEIGVILLIILTGIIGQWVISKLGIEMLLILTAPVHRLYLNVGFALKPFYVVVILILIGHLIFSRQATFAINVNRTFKLILAFLGVLFIVTVVNGAQVVSLRHLTLLSFVIVGAWILSNRIRTFDDIKRITGMYLHSGLVHAVIGLGLYALYFVQPGLCGEGSIFEGVTYDIKMPWSWPMLQSVDVGSNGYGMGLLPFLFVALGALLHARTLKAKMYCLVVFVLLFANLFLTFSRGGLVAFFLTSILMIITVKISKKWKILLVVGIIFLLAVFAPKIAELYKAYSFMKGAYSGEGSDLMSGRDELFMESLKVFWSSPLVGIGQGTIADSAVGKQSHNTYIELLAENGVVAFTVFSVLIMVVFWKSFAVLRRLKQGEEYYQVFSFIIGLVALLIAAIPTSAITMTLLWLQIAIVTSCIKVTATCREKFVQRDITC